MTSFVQADLQRLNPVVTPGWGHPAMRILSNSGTEDRAWEAFLERSPLGHFQQSSRWAQVKSLDGWKSHRVCFGSDQEILGGFQVLWKETRFGRIGYISKGPVLASEEPETVAQALNVIREQARELRLRALILQPPDTSQISSAVVRGHGFSPGPVPTVIDATLIVELERGPDAVEAAVSRKMRQHARNAARQGVSVFVGGREHLPRFFALMRETCRRQATAPNPSRQELMEALWDRFAPAVRLSFAQVGQELVAGLLMIGFGPRITFWRKGWLATPASANANALLNVRELCWASSQGYRCADFVGVDRHLAEQLLAGADSSVVPEHSRHLFNLRLGAQPRLLPRAAMLVSNPALRCLFNGLTRCSFGGGLVSRLISVA